MGLKRTAKPYKRLKRKGANKVTCRTKSAQKLIKSDSHHSPLSGTLTWYLPIKLESPNKQMHYRTKMKVNNSIHKKLLFLMPKAFDAVNLPCTIILSRVAPRKFDYDNLVYSFKFIRDTLADFLIPGLARGRADGDSRIGWDYMQETMEKGCYGVKITISYTLTQYVDFNDHV